MSVTAIGSVTKEVTTVKDLDFEVHCNGIGDICLNGWKGSTHVSRPRRDFCFPNLCSSQLGLYFRLVRTAMCTISSFPPYSTACFLRKGTCSVWSEWGLWHASSTPLDGCLQDQGSGCPRTHQQDQVNLKKWVPSLSPNKGLTCHFEDADCTLHANFPLLQLKY